MALCLIALGSNLGDRAATLHAALERLARLPGTVLLRRSMWHDTAPVGGPPGQERFLNGAALLETSLVPLELLAALGAIEDAFWRRRTEHWAPRTLDLDLLLYDDLIVNLPDLEIPHPRMAWRRFVIEPAAEITPGMLHPTLGWSIARLLDHLNSAAPYVAVSGAVEADRMQLAAALAQQWPAEFFSGSDDRARLVAAVAEPSGDPTTLWLESLDRWARCLTRGSAASQGALVSDFWFNELPAAAAAWLPEGPREDCRARWHARLPAVVEPKLIVLIDVPPPELPPSDRPAPEHLANLHLLAHFRRALARQAAQPGQGPLLRLTGRDAGRNLADVLSALESMN